MFVFAEWMDDYVELGLGMIVVVEQLMLDHGFHKPLGKVVHLDWRSLRLDGLEVSLVSISYW